MSRVLASVLLASVSCLELAAVPVREQADPAWSAEVLFERTAPLVACAVGDLQANHEGDEIAAATSEGDVLVAHRDGTRWVVEKAARVPGVVRDLVIADADPARPGMELLVVGAREGRGADARGGSAFLVYPPSPRGWSAGRIHLEEAPLTAAAVVDLDPSREGPEIVVAGEEGAVTAVFREGGGWSSEPWVELATPVLSLAAGMPALEALDRWGIGTGTSIVAALAGDAVLPLAARGAVPEPSVPAGPPPRRIVGAPLVHEAGRPQAAALLADGRVEIVWREAGAWRSTGVAPEVAGIRGLAAGEVVASREGAEVVLCTESGELWVLHRIGDGEGR